MTSAALSSLLPGTNLEIRVRAINSAGSGPASLLASVTTTGAGIAPGAFSFVTPGSHGVRTLVFTLGPPSSGGAPTSAVSRYRQAGQTEWTAGPTFTAAAIGISGLLPSTSYEVEVAGVNAAGQGPWFQVTGTTAAVAYMLDDLGVTARGAYSLRKLRSAWAGAAVRVRRDSDNLEADIGFDVVGILDVAALLAHTGAGSGFVVTWYDQSGNGRNFGQSTTTRQPRLVNLGAVEQTPTGAPAIRYGQGGSGQGTDLRQTANGALPANADYWLAITMEQSRIGVTTGALAGSATSNAFAYLLGGTNGTGLRWYKGGGDSTLGSTAVNGTLPGGQVNGIVTNYRHSESKGDIWINGVLTNDEVAWAGATQNVSLLGIGDYPGAAGSWVFTGYGHELIIGSGTLSDPTIAAIRTSQQGAWGAA